MPLVYDSGLPIPAADIGDGGAHSPQMHFAAPDSSCIWEGFPIELRACPLYPYVPADPAPASQLNTYSTGFGAGPFSPPATDWPLMYVYNNLQALLNGYKFQVRITGSVVAGSMQVGEANPASGANADPSNAYYLGPFDTGFYDVALNCSQAATFSDQAIYHGVILRPFSPLVGASIANGLLEGRWQPGGSGSASYNPFQTLAVVFGPPVGGYFQTALYKLLDGLASGSTSPPSANWTNGIFPGDAGITSGGKSATSGHGTAWWSAAQLPTSCKVSCYLAAVPTGTDSTWLYARLRNPGTGTCTGYAMEVNAASKTFTLYRIDGATLVQLATTTIVAPIKVGAGFQLLCRGDLIVGRYHPDDFITGCYADPFLDILSATDGTYRPIEAPGNEGYVGLGIDGTTQHAFDFSGGGWTDPMPGLYVYLETNSCGVLSKTYTQLATAINAASQPIVASINHNGGDTAKPGVGALAGCVASGALHERQGKAS